MPWPAIPWDYDRAGYGGKIGVIGIPSLFVMKLDGS